MFTFSCNTQPTMTVDDHFQLQHTAYSDCWCSLSAATHSLQWLLMFTFSCNTQHTVTVDVHFQLQHTAYHDCWWSLSAATHSLQWLLMFTFSCNTQPTVTVDVHFQLQHTAYRDCWCSLSAATHSLQWLLMFDSYINCCWFLFTIRNNWNSGQLTLFYFLEENSITWTKSTLRYDSFIIKFFKLVHM